MCGFWVVVFISVFRLSCICCIYIYILYNYGSTQTYTKLKMCNQLLRVSGNEKKTNITKYFFLKIYRYILIEYFVLNIYTKY